jgi:deoxycytidylate deaminase
MLRPVGIGYNGNYHGGPNECDLPNATGEARCGCVHAEMNAIAKAPYGKGQIAFVTVLPCALCAKQLYNAGVRKVVTIKSNDDEYEEEHDYRRSSVKLLEEMAVEVVYIDIEELERLLTLTTGFLSSLKNNENNW